ncbi:DUF3553 domain-containing protein [Phenylobacterium sp.]|uniref:DUF3553 domain-containing protein n=1 Tax=Phenylobacterium sp. TaxID=1871053 RepID=UPI0025FA9087|nr:DUF3553 domain-containing protein [Phenylobacterium sp.]
MTTFGDPFLEPGVLVRHPSQADWGLGQVQSAAGRKVTVNFEHAGKRTIDAGVVSLLVVGDDPRETDSRGHGPGAT